MNVDALNIKDVLMSPDCSEEDKITVLVQILECIDSGSAFPQLITDTLIACGIDRNQGSPSVKMLSYEILGATACDGDPKASKAIMDSVKYDLANPNGEVVYSALDALNCLTGTYLVHFVQTIDMEKIVRISLKNDFPMVRKQAVSTFALLVLRCQCALAGIAFKDEAYESQRGRAEQIQETMTKCREVIRCVAESLYDSDVRVVAECCKSLYMLIEENNTHIYSRADEGFNFHTSEEAKETLTISPSLVWELIPDVAELLLAQTYTIANRIKQCKGLEASYMIEGISEALLLALHFNEAAGYEWSPRFIRLEHMPTPQNVGCDEVASYWVRDVLTHYLTKGDAEAMFMAAKYTLLLSQYKLLSFNKQAWACASFVALIRVMQSKYCVIDPVAVADLMVEAIRYLPKELYFPQNDSVIQTLHGQAGIPSTRDLILISTSPEKIQREMFNIPTVSVCYRAIYTIRNVQERIRLLLAMARSLVVSMLREGNVDYAQKVMTSTFITNIFKQGDGDVFREEIVSSLLLAVVDEKPKNATKAAVFAWMKVTLNVLYSCADCLTWPSQSGVAAEKYLDTLFALCSYEDEGKKEHMAVETPMTPTTPQDDEDDEEERQLLLQRVLKHLVVSSLPHVTDASVRLQTIWVLAQFVRSIELQRLLLGIVLERLSSQDVEEVIKEDRYAKYDHTSLAFAGSISFETTSHHEDDLVLSDLLLRCVLLIVSDNDELAVIAYRSIQEYLKRDDLSLPARENALLVLSRISLSLPAGYNDNGFIIPDDDIRLETIYSFIGNFSPSQDTDCMKQEMIKNVHDPAELYRQSIQNSLISTTEEVKENQPQKSDKHSLVYKAPAIHLRSTLSGGSDPLLIVGSFRQQSETRQLILRMTIYNATQIDIAGLAVSIAAQGSLSMSSLRREAHFEMNGVLRPRASVTWEAPLEVDRFERGTAQPLVHLKKSEETITLMSGAMIEGKRDLVLPYTPIQIKFTDLLLPAPEHLLHTQPFRALWDRLGCSVCMDAIIEQQSGQTLSEHLAYEKIKGPETAIGYVDLPEMPAPNHLQAAGLCRTWNGDWLAYYCIGAYTVHPEDIERSPVPDDSATDPATATATVTPTPMEDDIGPKRIDATWKIQFEFRSTSEQVIAALRQNSQQWLDDLTDEQVRLVNLYENCMDENYRKMESVMFGGLSNMQIESDMSMDDIIYKWNVLKRNRKNRYEEVESDDEGEAAEADM